MRFIVMHKTDARWEAGAVPSPELIGRVGRLLGELAGAKVLHGAEGLRATSHGARLRFALGKRTVIRGPYPGEHELPAGFTLLRARTLDEAIDWASRQAEVLGDIEIDLRPVTEPWDIGLGPAPERETTRRFMALRKATPATEAGASPTAEQRARLKALAVSGMHLASETMAPSRRGRRYKNTRDGVRVIDGPFTESKELIAGYVIVSASSLDEVAAWADRYLHAVEADEVDVRELEEPLERDLSTASRP
jgi:hypothetical protein